MHSFILSFVIWFGLATTSTTLNFNGIDKTHRDKRVVFLAGWSPVRELLKGAKQIHSSDMYTRLFRKAGNYEAAVRDFNAVDPTSVSKFALSNGNEGMFGNADYRLIMLEKQGAEGKPTLRIMKFFGIGKNVEDKIVYTDKIIYDGNRRKNM